MQIAKIRSSSLKAMNNLWSNIQPHEYGGYILITNAPFFDVIANLTEIVTGIKERYSRAQARGYMLLRQQWRFN